MRTTDTVVIGAGQAGLAMSRCLAERGVDHVVLERGRVAERWRSERWDSLRLLSPNWMTRLPGWSYRGADPHGFMTAAEVVDLPRRLRRPRPRRPLSRTAPSVRLGLDGDGFAVTTTDQTWHAAQRRHGHGLVRPARRARARRGTRRLRSPRSCRPATGTPAGCPTAACSSSARRPRACSWPTSWPPPGDDVVLAVGRHSRMPRRYRGMDIFWWLERIGSLDRTIDEMADPASARREPSLQLVGRPDHARPRPGHAPGRRRRAGRAPHRRRRVRRPLRPTTSPSTVAAVDERRRQLLATIDAHIDASGLATEVLDPVPPRPVVAGGAPAHARPAGAGHRHRHLGDRAPAQLPVARAARPRRRGRDPPPPGRHAGPRPVRPRPAVPAPTQLELHRRRRPGRGRHRRPPDRAYPGGPRPRGRRPRGRRRRSART